MPPTFTVLRVWHALSVLALLRVVIGGLFPPVRSPAAAPVPTQCLLLDQATIVRTCSQSRDSRTVEWAHVFLSLPGHQNQTHAQHMVSVRELMLLIADDVDNGTALSLVDNRVLWLHSTTRDCWQTDPFYQHQCVECLTFIHNLTQNSALMFRHFKSAVIERMDCSSQEQLQQNSMLSTTSTTIMNINNNATLPDPTSTLSTLPSEHFQRQFSPNSTCRDCEVWYMRWLLVAFRDDTGEKRIWEKQPCQAWCHYAELACPFLGTSREADYAGLPAFRCQDPQITFSNSAREPEVDGSYEHGNTCNCIHPCDLLTMTEATVQSAVTRYIQHKLNCTAHLAHRDSCGPTTTTTTEAPTTTTTTDRTLRPNRALSAGGHIPPWPSFVLLCWWVLWSP